jgi:hypothetical protein
MGHGSVGVVRDPGDERVEPSEGAALAGLRRKRVPGDGVAGRVREGFDLHDLCVEAFERVLGWKLSGGGWVCALWSVRRWSFIVARWLAGGCNRRRAAMDLRLGRSCLFHDWN